MMKKLSIVFLVVVAVVFVVFLAKDIIIKASVEKVVETVTGLKLNIGSLHASIFKSVADIKNIQLFNPSGFPDRIMVDMPEIYVSYDLPAIIKGKIHLREVRLSLKEFVVIKNAQGKSNLDVFKQPAQAQKEDESKSQKTPGKAPEIKIDTLTLNIAKVIYKDYSKGSVPIVKEFNINLKESYSNIDSPQTLINLIVVKALMNTSIASLANFDLKGLQGMIGGVRPDAQKTGTQAMDKVKGLLKNIFGSGK
ncbi:MAG: AsmA family protein [Candidatus Omnitrophota bacterium]